MDYPPRTALAVESVNPPHRRWDGRSAISMRSVFPAFPFSRFQEIPISPFRENRHIHGPSGSILPDLANGTNPLLEQVPCPKAGILDTFITVCRGIGISGF